MRLPRPFKMLLACLAAIGAWTVGGVAPAAAAEPGCTLEGTGGTVTRTLGSQSYELHVPGNLTGDEVPLLLSLHGFGSTGRQDEQFTGWSGFADANNFIVAYPNGRPATGTGAWDPYSPNTADVSFLRQVADDIAGEWCVDRNRIHADGWSNGAVMSQRLACNAADKFASVTSYGGGTPSLGGAAPCRPSRPIAVGLIVGQLDFTFFGLAQNTSEWRTLNGCAANPVKTTDAYGKTDTYSCAGGTEVLSRVVNATSHEWPSGAKGADQRNRMWAFLTAHPLPGAP